MKNYVILFKDGGDGMGIETNCADADSFRYEFTSALSDLIEDGKFTNDWQFQLDIWMRNAFEIILKLKGYKTDVVNEKKILTAGYISHKPQDIVIDSSTYEKLKNEQS